MTFPGLELVVASSAADVIGLMAAAVRDPDPIIFHEHKSLYATKGEVPSGKIVDKALYGEDPSGRPGRCRAGTESTRN
jgi:acetoin:2,6-dichlorophenolindophenol oxidoreductase subunit beta